MAITLLAVAATLVHIVAASSTPGAMVFKSVKQAKLECRAYLKKTDHCNDLCELTVLRSWDKCSGLIGVPFAQHYQPNVSNVINYYDRTSECISSASKTSEGCHQATVESNCFKKHYGSPVGSSQLASLTDLQLQSVLESCASMLGMTPTAVMLSRLYDFNLDHNSRCLMRCILIREGLYSDICGPDLDRVYVQCGGYDQPLQDFKADAQKCVDNLRSQCMDKCMLAAKIASEFAQDEEFKLPNGRFKVHQLTNENGHRLIYFSASKRMAVRSYFAGVANEVELLPTMSHSPTEQQQIGWEGRQRS
ncbi:general odorant-binding protein 45-like [Uranotaenia lowii]|uniref:general odorant-binding protein 45-like n=1 Tax=Uranotaenia lowii TaxID=190385 RepID=UPI00247A260F|nr:general odorant-binding protein 45-like [Uranotaenia lowii]